jgi:hypothetical protein
MKGTPPRVNRPSLIYEEIPQPKRLIRARPKSLLPSGSVSQFHKPTSESLKGALGSVTAQREPQRPRENTGNVHFKITSVTVTGKTANGKSFLQGNPGMVPASGAERYYSVPILKDVCVKLEQIQFDVTAEALTLSSSHPMHQEMCLP